jgi:Fe-S oxidoreductase
VEAEMVVTFNDVRQAAKQLLEKRAWSFADTENFVKLLEAYVESLPEEQRKLATVVVVGGRSYVIKREDYPKVFREDPELARKLVEIWGAL